MSHAGSKPAGRQSVFQTLTCPLCREYMCPPITLCQAGHNICSRCRSGTEKCPTCERPLLDTRNVALETIARNLVYPCRFSPAGCRGKFRMDDVGKHHAQCPHRSYDCPLRELEGCKWTGRFGEIREHVETRHSTAVMAASQEQEATWELSNPECFHNSHHVLFACAEVFVLYKRFDISHRKLCLSVHRCGESPGPFRYSLRLDKNGGRQSVVLSDAAHGQAENVEQVFLSGECIKVDFDMLMAFVKGTRLLRIMATSECASCGHNV